MEDEEKKIEYASPMKRLWAWVGLVYMLLLILLTTYSISTGRYMLGIGPLMVSPALVGGGASAILNYRLGKGRGGLAACILLAGACFILAAVNLFQVVPVILEQL